jgi:hypothetical protein
MATYYYNEDATGTIDGLTEATGYDGSTTATLPDSSSGASRLSSVVGALQSGDILYVKRPAAGTDITWHASIITSTQSTDGPTRATGVGPVDIIGYGTTTDDGIRPNINMQTFVWRFQRAAGSIKHLNFKGSYTNAGMLRVADSGLLQFCRVECSAGPAAEIFDEGKIDRCELINTESLASPSSYQESALSLYGTDQVSVTNCYIESRNGSHGIYVRRRAGGSTITNNIINVNLDADGAGNSNGHGIIWESAAYSRGSCNRNIVHNANIGIQILRTSTDDRGPLTFNENIISSCTKGMDGDSFYNQPLTTLDSRNQHPLRVYNNFYYANTSQNGFINNEDNATVLTEDPFVDVSKKDFTIKNPSILANGFSKEFRQAGTSASDHITRNSIIGIRVPGEISRSF